jgi:hypothetical protein
MPHGVTQNHTAHFVLLRHGPLAAEIRESRFEHDESTVILLCEMLIDNRLWWRVPQYIENIESGTVSIRLGYYLSTPLCRFLELTPLPR